MANLRHGAQPTEDGRNQLTGLVLVAAGQGSRFGGKIPKQFRLLDGEPLYLAALRKFLPFTRRIVIVVPESWTVPVREEVSRLLEECARGSEAEIIQGGATRPESVLKGLRCLQGQCSHVIVHDAVRPFLTGALISRVIRATLEYGAAVPLEPVIDTIKVVRDHIVVDTLDRNILWRAQTPQGSELEQLLEASEKAWEKGFAATDESALLERAGLEVRAVEGENANIKITWKEDLAWRDVDET